MAFWQHIMFTADRHARIDEPDGFIGERFAFNACSAT
jgi:hypothetical protein